MKELKMTKNQKNEVIRDSLNNMDYLEIRSLVLNLLESATARNNIYNYLADNHERVLNDSLVYNEIIEE